MINLIKRICRRSRKSKSLDIADIYFPWLKRFRQPDGSYKVPMEVQLDSMEVHDDKS